MYCDTSCSNGKYGTFLPSEAAGASVLGAPGGIASASEDCCVCAIGLESLGLVVWGLSGPSSHCGLENRLLGAGVGLLEESRSIAGDRATEISSQLQARSRPSQTRELIMTRLHTRGGMRMPWKGEGTLHLDHLSIWIYTGKGPELSQLRDTSLYILVRGL